MELAALARPDLIFPDLPGSDRQTVLRAISERFEAAGVVEPGHELYRKLLEREDLGSTCVLPGVAIPHCKIKGLGEVVVSVGISPEGVDFGADDDEPVKVFFTVISPDDQPSAHLQSLAVISRWIKNNSHIAKLLEQRDGEEILDFLTASEDGGG